MSETKERVDPFHIRVAFEFDADKQQGISFVHGVRDVQPTAAELLKLMHCYRSEETEGLLRDVRETAQKWRKESTPRSADVAVVRHSRGHVAAPWRGADVRTHLHRLQPGVSRGDAPAASDVPRDHPVMDRIFDTPWYSLEQAVYEPLGRSRDVGVCFDVVRAEALVLEMTQAMATAAREIQRVLPPIEVEEWFTPKRDNAKKGYRKGEPFRKVKKVPLNPNPRCSSPHAPRR